MVLVQMESQAYPARTWQARTFGKVELMARRPLLDMLNILNAFDWRSPTLRFLIHGLPGSRLPRSPGGGTGWEIGGTGKATTLSQLAQVAIDNGWTLAYFPNCSPPCSILTARSNAGARRHARGAAQAGHRHVHLGLRAN